MVVSKAKTYMSDTFGQNHSDFFDLCLHLASVVHEKTEQYVSLLEHLKCIEKVSLVFCSPDPTTNSGTPNLGFTTIFEQLEQVLAVL